MIYADNNFIFYIEVYRGLNLLVPLGMSKQPGYCHTHELGMTISDSESVGR